MSGTQSRGYRQIGTAGLDFDAGGVHTRHVDDEFHRVGVLLAVVVGLTERDGGRRLGGWTASVGDHRVDYRMHGRKMKTDAFSSGAGGLRASGLNALQKWMV